MHFAFLLLLAAFGISEGIWPWVQGRDTLTIILGITGLALLLRWRWFYFRSRKKEEPTPESDYDWTNNKKAIYDKNGHVKGYVDKD